MNTALAQQPFSSNELPVDQIQSSYTPSRNGFPSRRPKSSCLISGHSKNFKNVETFNLHPAYSLSRSAGKIYVAVQTKDTAPIAKPKPKKFNIAEMEALIVDLREQVSLLSTFLEEERLRHAGTKKRAALDLEQKEKDLTEKFEAEIATIRREHGEEKQNAESLHEFHLKEVHSEHDEIVEKMKTEYRMLQASFKIYRSTLQEEMQDELKLKRTEFEWEKKRALEDATEQCKKEMEENFSNEREVLRKEFRANLTTIMKNHKEEVDAVKEKYMKNAKSIEELRNRSKQLDVVEEDFKHAKELLKEEKAATKRAKSQLTEVNMQLHTLQTQFNDKVAFVEEQHRALIDSLKLEKADVKNRLVRSNEDLQTEKIAREIEQKERKEAAIKTMKARLCDCERNMEKLQQHQQPYSHPASPTSSCDDPTKHHEDQRAFSGSIQRRGSPMNDFPYLASNSNEIVVFDGIVLRKELVEGTPGVYEEMLMPHYAASLHGELTGDGVDSEGRSADQSRIWNSRDQFTSHTDESGRQYAAHEHEDRNHQLNAELASGANANEGGGHSKTKLASSINQRGGHSKTELASGSIQRGGHSKTKLASGINQRGGYSKTKLPSGHDQDRQSHGGLTSNAVEGGSHQHGIEFSFDVHETGSEQSGETMQSKFGKQHRVSFSQPEPGLRNSLDQNVNERAAASQGSATTSASEFSKSSSGQMAEGALHQTRTPGIAIQIGVEDSQSPDSGISQDGSDSASRETSRSRGKLSRGESLAMKANQSPAPISKKDSRKKSSVFPATFAGEDDDEENSHFPFTLSPYGTKRRHTRKPSTRDLMPPSLKSQRSPSLYGAHLFSSNSSAAQRRVTVLIPEGHIQIAAPVPIHTTTRTSIKHIDRQRSEEKDESNNGSERPDSPEVIY